MWVAQRRGYCGLPQRPAKFSKLVNRGRHVTRATSLGQLPKTAYPPRPDGPLEGMDIRAFARALYNSL